jgi:DNA helicase-2/ATP-dependent DNA helicase PcrA
LVQNLFSIGDRVKHPVFGEGTILRINQSDSTYAIKFDNIKTERNVVFEGKLQKV